MTNQTNPIQTTSTTKEKKLRDYDITRYLYDNSKKFTGNIDYPEPFQQLPFTTVKYNKAKGVGVRGYLLQSLTGSPNDIEQIKIPDGTSLGGIDWCRAREGYLILVYYSTADPSYKGYSYRSLRKMFSLPEPDFSISEHSSLDDSL